MAVVGCRNSTVLFQPSVSSVKQGQTQVCSLERGKISPDVEIPIPIKEVQRSTDNELAKGDIVVVFGEVHQQERGRRFHNGGVEVPILEIVVNQRTFHAHLVAQGIVHREIVEPDVALADLERAMASEMGAQIGDIGFEGIHMALTLNSRLLQ